MTGLPRLTIMAAIAVMLTSLSLQPTLADGTWLLPTILCVAAVAATGYVARRVRVPRLLIPLLELGVLALVLVQRFAHAETIWLVLPGHDVVTQARTLLDEGFHTISSYAPPAPVTPGLMFLLAGSIGLVAVVVDTIAVTYRSPALAGLPLLVLYAVPVSVVSHGVSWVYFGIAAAGWLALLLADGRERLGGWGRRLGTRTFAGDPTTNNVPVVAEPLGAVGRRIGVASVAAAILLPAIVPGLSEAVFGRGLGDGTGGGGGTVNTVNPFVNLASDLNRPADTEVLSYTTDDPSPGYLTLVTLDTFDGKIWLPASLETSGHLVDGQLPAPTGLAPTTATRAVQTQIQLKELAKSTWLPVPYPVTSVQVDKDSGRWLWDTTNRVIWSADDDVKNLKYSASSLAVQPTADQLEAAPSVDPGFLDDLTAYPADVAQDVVDTAHKIVEGAKTPYARAVALQDYFRDPANGFQYRTDSIPRSDDPLSSFLQYKIGFCQQFAGTFAVMARIVGLPTRVAVGFTPGEHTQGNIWSVTWHDTHAWPEVYFENVGWVRFEPTPRPAGAGVTVPSYTLASTDPRADRQQPDATASGGPDQSGSDAPSVVPSANLPGPRADQQGVTTDQSSFPWVWVLVPVLVVVVLLLPWAIRLRQRRGRSVRAGGDDPRDAAAAAWEELVATCVDLDLAWPASRTPRQVAATLIDSTELERADASVGPPAADALRRLALTTERARYARTAQTTPGLVADVTAARAGLLAWGGRFKRLRATFAPRSMLAEVGTRTADTLDWVDTAPRRARHALGTRRSGRRPSERTDVPSPKP